MNNLGILLFSFFLSLQCFSQETDCQNALLNILSKEVSVEKDEYLGELQYLRENCLAKFEKNDSLLAIFYLAELRSLYCICEDPLEKEKLEFIKKTIKSRDGFQAKAQAIFERFYGRYLHSELDKKKEAVQFLSKSYERISSMNPIDSFDLINSLTRLAVYKLYLKDQAKEGQSILRGLMKDLEDKSQQNTTLWLDIATDYLFHTYEIVVLDSVLDLAYKIRNTALEMGHHHHGSLLTVYKKLGQVYSRKKDYYHALKYYRLFEEQAVFHNSNRNIAMAKYQIGNFYFEMKDFEKAKYQYLKVFDHQNLYDHYDYHAAQVHRKLAACYLYLNDEKESKRHENIIREYYRSINVPLFQVIIDKTIADAELANGKFSSASKKYKTAIQEWGNQFGFINHHVISSNVGLTDAMLGMGQLDSVLHFCNKIKKSLNYSSKDRSIQEVDDLSLLSKILNVECRFKRSAYQSNPSIENLDSLNSIYEEFLEVFDAIRLNYRYGKSTQLLLEENLDIIEMGIAHYTNEYNKIGNDVDFRQVLHFMEISQSFQNILLLESANIRESNEAEELLNMKKQLDILANRKNNGENDLEDSIRQLTILYDEAVSQMQYDNPLRKETQFNSLTSVSEIRKKLSGDQALVLFYQGSKDIFGLFLSKEDEKLYRWKDYAIHHQDQFIETVQLSPISEAKMAMDSLYSISRKFFDPCLKEWKSLGIQHLRVYADGWLTALGMKLSIAYNEDYRDHFESANLLSIQQYIHQDTESKKTYRNKMLALVPNYQDSPQYDYAAIAIRAGSENLPFAKEEAEQIIRILGGDIMEGADLHKKIVLEKMGQYDIIHFAGHTVMDREFPSQSRLILNNVDSEDSYITSAEIHHLKLKSKLTTLSSCNSGAGQYNKLDGFNSLAKSFYYAGSESLLASLWQVPDQSTKKIMEYFYSFLKEGLAKPEALKLAKSKYIETAISEEELHPFYWSGFVIIGSEEGIILDNQNYILYILSFLALALVVVFFFRKSKLFQ